MSLRDNCSWRPDFTRIVVRFASLRDPGAVTGAARAFASPNASAAVPSEMSGAFGPLIARPHSNPYTPGRGNSSLHRGRAASVANDGSVGDLKAIPKCWLARSATSDSENAPIAVIFGAGKSWIRDCGQTQSHSKRERPAAKPPTNQERLALNILSVLFLVTVILFPRRPECCSINLDVIAHRRPEGSASRPTRVFGQGLSHYVWPMALGPRSACDISSPFT